MTGMRLVVVGAAAVLAWSGAAPVAADGEAAAKAELEARAADIADVLEVTSVYVDPGARVHFSAEKERDIAGRIDESGAPFKVVVLDGVPPQAGESGGSSEKHVHYLLNEIRLAIGDDDLSLLGALDGELYVQQSPAEREELGPYGPDVESYPGLVNGATAALGREQAACDHFGKKHRLPPIERVVEIATSEDPEALYWKSREGRQANTGQCIHRDAERDRMAEAGSAADGGADWAAVPSLLGAAVVACILAGIGIGYFRWKPTRARPPSTIDVPRQNVRKVQMGDVRRKGGTRLTEVGKRLGAAEAAVENAEAAASLQRALDAHSAARKVYEWKDDPGSAMASSAGVLVLLDMAEDHLERAEALEAGEQPPAIRRHCYADPLHGTETTEKEWFSLGRRVPLCGECTDRLERRRGVAALSVVSEGRTYPYYMVPARHSVWSATGFGTIADDLVERVQRGEYRRRWDGDWGNGAVV